MSRDPSEGERRPQNQGPKAAPRNRAALIAAARHVYAEQGLGAPLSAVARRAGVGQGVMYRHFPDRDAVAAAVLEENVRQVEGAAAAPGADLAGALGVVTWHLTESAAFINLLHLDVAGGGEPVHGYAHDLSARVEVALRRLLPPGHRLAPDGALMLAVSMVSGAVVGAARQDRERRALAAWRLLAVEVGPVRPFPASAG
ncbi:transcriptional regulator, TetR family [Streptomyces zhaozhouensis]|uniref:Transcriptional regulator, TetR family n=1 Tax=Streptomyces zhaozhouensis TaxID=1300267 RepID=A0A286DUH8_9ACTN|nr:helix-turn-helix domain-containing protein [Streptomyces zhaozhouensis]SOD62214.1 transcriptional regulator, TetR family [Streptomyces zhaozhouensis]